MILISHRGNIKGPDRLNENKPSYITRRLEQNFDCEIDIRYIDGQYYLGHDYPIYTTNKKFLLNGHLWCHAKDGTTLRQALKDKIHCFYAPDTDFPNYSLTSRGYIWHYDGKNMIYIMDKDGLMGVCSDYVGYLK
jgi:hypothetical protein